MLTSKHGKWKVKFRVYKVKKHDRCKKIHPVPTHRYIFYQGEGTEHDVVQNGHGSVLQMLKGEDKKNGTISRPYFQYTIELGE